MKMKCTWGIGGRFLPSVWYFEYICHRSLPISSMWPNLPPSSLRLLQYNWISNTVKPDKTLGDRVSVHPKLDSVLNSDPFGESSIKTSIFGYTTEPTNVNTPCAVICTKNSISSFLPQFYLYIVNRNQAWSLVAHHPQPAGKGRC